MAHCASTVRLGMCLSVPDAQIPLRWEVVSFATVFAPRPVRGKMVV